MFRFTIRDVLWLTVLVASLVALWLDRGRLWQRAEADRQTVELYKKHKLDLVLEEMLHPRPAVNFVKVQRIPYRIPNSDYQFPNRDYQFPPEVRTPWIEKVQRQIIDEEKR